jgi:predicted PurR-regulated permease PerM
LPPLREIVFATTAVVVTLGVLALISRARVVFFMAFFAVLLATILERPVSFLARWVPRPVAAALTLVAIGGVVTALVFAIRGVVAAQAARIAVEAPRALERIQAWWRDTVGAPGRFNESLKEGVSHRLSELVASAFSLATGLVSVVSGAVLLLVTALFLAYDPNTYLKGIVRLVPRDKEEVATELLRRLGLTLQGWLRGTLIAMTAVGVATAIGLKLVGIEGWFVLAVLMFFGEFVPFIGPISAAIPGIAVGFALSPAKAVYALVVYLAVQQAENHLLVPLVMRRTVQLHPALLIFWQLFMVTAFGILGLLVATPLLACLRVTVDYFYVERSLGKA